MDEDRILAAIAESSRDNRPHTEALSTQLTGLRTEFTTFRSEVMSRFERVEDKLALMADDITVNMLAVNAETTKRHADQEATRTLVDMMRVMNRQIRRMRTELDELKDQNKAS